MITSTEARADSARVTPWKQTRLKRCVYALFALLFLYAAALQLNDPDPLYWITIYTAVAVISVASAVRPVSRLWTAITIGGAAAGALIAGPGFLEYLGTGDFGIIVEDMHAAESIEPAREFVGLLLSLCVLIHLIRQKQP